MTAPAVGKRSRTEKVGGTVSPAPGSAGPAIEPGARTGIGDEHDWLADVLDGPVDPGGADALAVHAPAEQDGAEPEAEEQGPPGGAEGDGKVRGDGEDAADGAMPREGPPKIDGAAEDVAEGGDGKLDGAGTDADKTDGDEEINNEKASAPEGENDAAARGAAQAEGPASDAAGAGAATVPASNAAANAVDAGGDDVAPEGAPPATPDEPAPEPVTRAAVREAAGDIDEAVAAESATLGQAFATKRDELSAEAETQSGALIAASLAEYGATLSALTQREATVRAVFTVWRTNVTIAKLTQVALARTDANDAIERVKTGSSGIDTQMRDGAKAEGDRMVTAARTSSSKISASGRVLRSEVDAVSIGDLSSIAANIKPDEERAINNAVAKAKRETKSGVTDEANRAHEKLYGGATKNAEAFGESAEKLIKKVGAKLPEHEAALRKGGDATAILIEKMAGNQELGIATAEREVLIKIAAAKAQAANVLHAGRRAAAELKTKVVTQIAALNAQEAAAKGQLRAAGAQVGAQLAQQKRMQRSQARVVVRHARGALREGVQQQTAALDTVAAPALASVRAAPANFSAAVGERRALMLSGIDSALSTAGGMLATSFNELVGSCIGFRTAAMTTYVAAEVQIVAGVQPEIQKAREQWKTKADEFVASCVSYETEALDKHNQARAGLPAQMTAIGKKTVKHLRRTGWQKFKDGVASGLGRIAGGLKWFVLGVIAVTIVIVIFVAGIPLGLALAIAAAIVGIIMLAVGFVMALYNRFKMLWNNDWPWWAKILGIPAAFGVAVGDVLGFSQIAEAIRGKELISDKDLSDEERWARATEGAFQVITLGLARWFTKKPASTRKPPPPGDTPPPGDHTPPGETPPPANETPPPANETPSPANETPPPANETPPPANETPPPANETPPPANETPPPANETPPPPSRTPEPRHPAPPTNEPPTNKPPTSEPPANEPPVRPKDPEGPAKPPKADPEPPPRKDDGSHDFSGRENKELVRDADPEPMRGESDADAALRAKEAQQEVVRRSADMEPCFVAGTLVTTPDGPMPIESLRVGTRVIAMDPDAPGTVRAYPILEVYRGTTDALRHITVAGQRITATLNHRFFVIDKAWVPARDLAAGDRLLTPAGALVEIDEIADEALAGEVATFNMHVAEVSTYFVGGETAVLVHNNDPDWGTTRWWILDNKAKFRATDTDGPSMWKTETVEDVRDMFRIRKGIEGRAPDAAHRGFTPDELAAKGISVRETPGTGPLAGRLQHGSARPADPLPADLAPTANDPLALSEEGLQKTVKGINESGGQKAMPKTFGCKK